MLKNEKVYGVPYEDKVDVLSRDVTERAFGPVRRNAITEGTMQDGKWTALQCAARYCWPLICAELIDRGADVTAVDKVVMM